MAGAINISDDIATFGVDQRAHDKALNEVLQKLQNAGLTANLEKCEFGKNKMEFFGLVFSDKGVSPDPKKVADLHDAKESQNQSEVRSFLGMAQFSIGVRANIWGGGADGLLPEWIRWGGGSTRSFPGSIFSWGGY